MERKSHWENVYRTKSPDEVSWYQQHSELSLALIRDEASGREAAVLDVKKMLMLNKFQDFKHKQARILE